MRSSVLITAAAALVSPAMAAYQLKENFFDGDFFSHFNFWTEADPTHGLVQFVSQSEAQSSGLISSNGSSAWMGADSTTVLTGNQGRKATRLTSKASYTHMLTIITVEKLPVSCGAWPAFWTVGPNWPNQGEIDIIESVNTDGANRMTLHTSGGCSAAGQAGGLLQPSVSDCQGHEGCGFTESSDISWQDVNKMGGGTWAMEWTSDGISIWWWGGSNPVPANVKSENPVPSSWGKPSMNVPNGDNCNIDSHFSQHQLVFDLTFCGDWAGSQDVWDKSSCKQQADTCQQFVQNNPQAFKGVGFDVRYLKVFTNDGKADAPAASGSSSALHSDAAVVPSAATSFSAVAGPSDVTGSNAATSIANAASNSEKKGSNIGSSRSTVTVTVAAPTSTDHTHNNQEQD